MALGASLRQYTGNKIIQKGEGEQFAAFCLFMGTLLKNCALLSGNENTLKLKLTTKLKDKECERLPPSRPLLSHYRIPLKRPNRGIRLCTNATVLFYLGSFITRRWDGMPGAGTGSGSHEQGVRIPPPQARPPHPPLHLLKALQHCAKVEQIFSLSKCFGFGIGIESTLLDSDPDPIAMKLTKITLKTNPHPNCSEMLLHLILVCFRIYYIF
jgi:hypothetical protein